LTAAATGWCPPTGGRWVGSEELDGMEMVEEEEATPDEFAADQDAAPEPVPDHKTPPPGGSGRFEANAFGVDVDDLADEIDRAMDEVSGIREMPHVLFAMNSGLASPNEASSWDKMCQQLAALVAVERSLFDRGVVDPADLDSLRQRLRRLAVALGFETGGSEWPRMFAKSGGISPAAVAHEMAAIRDQLAQIAAREAIR